MKQKIVHLILCLFLCSLNGFSQGLPHTDFLRIKLGHIEQVDSYLSPLIYDGTYIGLSNEWFQPLRKKKQHLEKWLHEGSFEAGFAQMYNPMKSNAIRAYYLHTEWGPLYKAVDIQNFHLFVSPIVNFDGHFRFQINNVNKPFSTDVGLDLSAFLKLDYTLVRKKKYRFNYDLKWNVVGTDYLLDYWQSYYEVANEIDNETDNIGKNWRLAGLWNRQNIKQEFSVDFIFNKVGVKVGINHNYNHTFGKNITMERNMVNLVVGLIFCYEYKTL